MSIITSVINPTYARDLTGYSSFYSVSEREAILSYKKYGGGSYSFASAIICLYPMLIYYYKNIRKSYLSKRCLILYIIIIFYAVIRMQFFANILISVIVIVLSLLGTKNVFKTRIYFIALVVMLLFIPMQYYIDILIYIKGWFSQNSEVHHKINDLVLYITHGNYLRTEIGTRADRYPLLWESFISNPLWGGKYSNGHLYWMNKLAVYGLIGTIPFLFIVYNHIKKNLKYFDAEFSLYFMISIFSIIALGAIKALTGIETWYVFFIVLPGFYYFPLIKKEKKQFIKKEIKM